MFWGARLIFGSLAALFQLPIQSIAIRIIASIIAAVIITIIIASVVAKIRAIGVVATKDRVGT